MRKFKFFKFSPAGNVTVFLLREPEMAFAWYCRQALGPEGVGGEQAGIVDLAYNRLQMAGGEFCANASRAFGALLNLFSPAQDSFQVQVSGLREKVLLKVSGHPPVWDCEAEFSMPDLKICTDSVEMEGITHIYKECADFPPLFEAEALGRMEIARRGLETLPAAGHVWWRQTENGLEILPYVVVPEAKTAMLESACGSASIGLSALLDLTGCRILQPSGQCLSIRRNCTGISVSGPVSLIAGGEIWLPESNSQ